MPKLEVITDGTTKAFQIILDGEDITKTMNITNFSLSAYANDEYLSFDYSTSADYTNDAGEKQGTISKRYSYSNGGWQTDEETRTLGGEASDSLGGKQLKDITLQDKLSRLAKLKGEYNGY